VLLQFEPTNAHSFIKITIILQHTNQPLHVLGLTGPSTGAHNPTKQPLNIFCV